MGLTNKISSLGSAVTDPFRKKDYSVDDELFSRYSHDVKQYQRGLRFLAAQTKRTATSYWPHLLESLSGVASLMDQLFGENSLDFEGKDALYTQFDALMANSDHITIHPKERETLVASLALETANFAMVAAQLAAEILPGASVFAAGVGDRIKAMDSQLKSTQRTIKTRQKLKDQCSRLESKISKLEKKPLLDADQEKKFRSLESELQDKSAQLTKFTTHLKTTLPETLLLVEEFTDSLIKLCICHFTEQLQKVHEAFEYFSQFHGFSSKTPPDTDTIIAQWEEQATSTRLQIESLLSLIREKNPALLDTEINAEDNSSRAHKMWSSLSTKVREKHHTVKALDMKSGIFNSHSMADPLSSYKTYNDPAANLSDVYYPKTIPTVHIDTPKRASPPPLPPRTETAIHLTPNLRSPNLSSGTFTQLPHSQGTQGTHSPGMSSHNTFGSTPVWSPRASQQSTFSPPTTPESEPESDSDSSVSEVASDLSALKFTKEPENLSRTLSKIYNSAKNDITQVPVLPSKYDVPRQRTNRQIYTDESNSATFKLVKLGEFLSQLSAPGNTAVAKASYEGQQPGDLSFSAGDKVDVLLDLQSQAMTYNPTGSNWMVGAVGDRIGFAPANYLA